MGHTQWVFAVPKILRVYFLYHRELLGALSLAVARVLVQIPDARRHSARYYGAYSNAARGKRKKAAAVAEPSGASETTERGTTAPDGAVGAALRRRWAEMIRRVHEVDALVCPRCGGQMRVVWFITDPA